jgi:hypothetical protein
MYISHKDVSVTRPVSVIRCKGQRDFLQLGTLGRVHWLGSGLSNGPNWVGKLPPLHLKTERIQFPKRFMFVVYFATLPSRLYSIVSDGKVTDELERIWKEADVAQWSTISVLAWRYWGKQWKTSVRVACALAEIQTKHLPNRSLQRLLWTTLFGGETSLCIYSIPQTMDSVQHNVRIQTVIS